MLCSIYGLTLELTGVRQSANDRPSLRTEGAISALILSMSFFTYAYWTPVDPTFAVGRNEAARINQKLSVSKYKSREVA
jgi:hypothetical protein